jgi:IPT/TIG domain.
MAVEVQSLKPTSNEITLDRIRNRASPDYRARIPAATQAGVQATMKALMEYRPSRNEFIDALVNRIGLVIAQNMSWSNPLAEFKRGILPFGDTIEEYHMGLIKARTYDADRDSLEKSLFGTKRVEVQSNFHKINRMDKYELTIDNPMLNRAFLETNGLTNFISQTMETFTTSDNWDEFLLTCQLFSEYEFNNGFFKVQVPDVSAPNSTEADAKSALRKIRAMADNLTFISTKYNPAGMPMHAQRSDLLLFVSPEFNAAIDVEALAGAFNISKAQMNGRIIPIPADRFAIDGVQAIMTTKEFFVIADTLFETTQMWNPDSLQNNQWLHHHQIVSASRFVPAVLFTSEVVEEITVTQNPVVAVTSISVTDKDGADVTNVNRGELYQFTAVVDTVLDDGTNETVRWDVAGNTSLLTYITQNGVLHVAGTEDAGTLDITAITVWIDPEGAETVSKTLVETVTVVGEKLVLWPVESPTATVPTIASVTGTPNPAGEGEMVTITGTGFGTATVVKFGATNATDFTIVSGAVIEAVVPAGAAGVVAVTVTNATGVSAGFNYTRDV